MNKTLAIACLAILFASAAAQTANSTASASTAGVGSFCMRNEDCD